MGDGDGYVFLLKRWRHVWSNPHSPSPCYPYYFV